MVMSFKDFPIRRKLMAVIILTTGTALLVASFAFITYEVVSFRESMVRNLSTLAGIIGDAGSSRRVAADASRKETADERAHEEQPRRVAR